MKFYTSPRAPSPRRVSLFVAEKGITGLEEVTVSIANNAHKSADFLAKNPLAKVPALELDDGRILTETRAICTYLEGMYPAHNLMGVDATERAFIEMADRRIELYLFSGFANSIRHTHPGFVAIEQPQFPDFGAAQSEKVREVARWLDGELAHRPFVAGERFTIADITTFVALEFGRGLMKFVPGDEGMPHLQAYRDRWMLRASAKVQ